MNIKNFRIRKRGLVLPFLVIFSGCDRPAVYRGGSTPKLSHITVRNDLGYKIVAEIRFNNRNSFRVSYKDFTFYLGPSKTKELSSQDNFFALARFYNPAIDVHNPICTLDISQVTDDKVTTLVLNKADYAMKCNFE